MDLLLQYSLELYINPQLFTTTTNKKSHPEWTAFCNVGDEGLEPPTPSV